MRKGVRSGPPLAGGMWVMGMGEGVPPVKKCDLCLTSFGNCHIVEECVDK